MEKFLKIGVPVLFFILVAIFVFVICYNAYAKSRIRKMYLNVEEAILALIPEDEQNNFKFNKLFQKEYDYIFETPNYIYYIKVVPNLKNQEICVNNAMKWQLRKSFNDESLRFVQGIEGLIRMDLKDEKKAEKKLFIVYPNARTLLKYVNECEMIFIDYDTDVYGSNIIPYIFLRDNKDKIKI